MIEILLLLAICGSFFASIIAEMIGKPMDAIYFILVSVALGKGLMSYHKPL